VLSGAPVICGLLGDQQASLIGQGCLRAGDAKITFGTGGMLDLCSGERSEPPRRGAQGTFPIVAWRDRSRTVFGREGVILSAGSAVDLLVSGLGVLDSAASSEEVARSTRDSAGLVFVPALGGFGTPLWDHGARGALLGVHNGTTRAEVVRAVLEGIAHRGRDLLDAVEADEGVTIDELGIDGGMSSNSLFVQIVANAMGRPLRKSGSIEATTIGAAMVGGVGYGLWDSLESAAAIIPVAERVEPDGSLDRSRWLELREHALRTVPALSMLTF
jgi:glycerol kinase